MRRTRLEVGVLVSGDQIERLDVAGSHGREVAMIERSDLLHAKTLGDRDQAGIRPTEGEVAIAIHQLGVALVVGGSQRLDPHVTARQRPIEASLSGRFDMILATCPTRRG